jgi:hypothetical protein
MHKQWTGRVGAMSAIIGALLLFVGTYLHPMGADPNMLLAAFTEYAADHHWVTSHLMQLFGVILMGAALVLLSRRLADGPAAEWATLGNAGAIAGVAVTSALQAVDGIALKLMVDSWAAAPEPEKAAVFQAAFGVRQIEIGLASVSSVLFGVTVSIYGLALLVDHRFPRWLGAFAIAAGAPTAIAGLVMAYTGFSGLAMAINIPSGSLLILWMVVLGVYGWKQSNVLGP